jgi:two-component sensor histidine kinase
MIPRDIESPTIEERIPSSIPRPAAAATQKLVRLRAFVDLPMQVKGKTVGTIVAGVRNPPITSNQQKALARVAGQAAVAIENARLYEAERQRSVELARSNAFITALSQVAARIETTPDPDRVLETLGTELRRLGVTYFLGLLEPDAHEVVGHYTSVHPATLAMAEKVAGLSVRSLRLPRDRWPVREVIEPGLAHFVPDLVSAVAIALPHLPRPVVERAARLAGVTSEVRAAYLPLKVEEEVLGLMALWGQDLREEDVPALSVFANQVAVAFENARLYERTLREVSARMQAEEKIKASLLEKEILLREIHHRVKNNLQVISSLLNLQSAHIRDPRMLESFRDSQNRIRSMALIHERLYQSQELAKVDLAEYARNLATYLFRVYGDKAQSVSLEIEAEGVFLEVDTAVLCGLILNELISNSLKHAFPDGRSGRICIGLQSHREGQLNLEVGDNGVGLPSDLDLGNTESLGMQLVNTLVDQLGGRLEYNSRNGMNFKIAFSVSEDRD